MTEEREISRVQYIYVDVIRELCKAILIIQRGR